MSSTTAGERLHREMAACWRWRIETDPELAASFGLLSKRRSGHALDPRSVESFALRSQWMERALQRVRRTVPRDELDGVEDVLSYDLYVKQLTDYIAYAPRHRAYLCCINRLEGPQTDLPLYAKYLPVRSKAERDFYIAFCEAIPTQIHQVVELLRVGLREGRTPPRVSLDGVVEQIRGMIDGGLIEFTDPLKEYPDAAKECRTIVDGPVKESFRHLVAFLEHEYVPNLRTGISAVVGYPNGDEYYRDCLLFHTTTRMSPQEIHALGLREVQRVTERMKSIAAQSGYDGRLDEYLEHLRTSSQYEPSSGEALCARFRDITGRIAPAMLKLFHLYTLPRMPFSITETPAAQAIMAPAAYYLAGSADPSSPRPGVFYVNTSELSTRRTYECEALALHEAIPGHHTQGAIQGENPSLPDFRRFAEDRRYFEAPCRFPFYTGYIEGWGLHCETLGEELGLYETPEDRMGQLSMEALRSCRLVVDTGMHAMGWTQEQAVEYMLSNTAMGRHDAVTEVMRYITWPGQACAYKGSASYAD